MQEDSSTKQKLDRRDFLRTAGAVALGGATISQAKTALGEEQRTEVKNSGMDYDVIVVGGGFAGVAAARDCRENGYSTLILEARNRLGGRTFKADFEGVPVELGGFWIHPTQPFIWAEKERYGLEIEETPGARPDRMLMSTNGALKELSEEQIFEAANAWQIFTAAAAEVLPRPWDIRHNREAMLEADSVSCMEVLDKTALSEFQKQFLTSLFSVMAHHNARDMPYLEALRWHQCGGGYFPTVMDSAARFSLKDGTNSLIEAMLEDASPEVRVMTPVKAIEELDKSAVVTTQSGEQIRAAAVIACLPMNTIGNIKFNPALPPGVIEAGKQRHLGSGFKIYMKVKGNAGNLQGFALDNPIDSVMTYKQTDDYTILVGFGHDTDALDVYDDDAVQDALRALVPDAEISSTMVYDWNNDPYSRGTWGMYRTGWIANYLEDFDRDLGRIFFGCSDHGEGWRGFIDGAIGGGIRSAQRVKELLG